MKYNPRDVKLFEFYNEVGKKHPGSPLVYKAGPAKTRERFLRRVLKKDENALTLDLGCSDGHYRQFIKNYVGLDISLGYLKRFSGNRVWGVAEHLPFKNNVFDRVFLSEVLEHLWSRRWVLRGCWRVLKDPGLLIVSAPYGKAWRHIQKNWESLEQYGIKYCPYVHGHFTEAYLANLLRQSKFRIEWIKRIVHKQKRRFVVAKAWKGEVDE